MLVPLPPYPPQTRGLEPRAVQPEPGPLTSCSWAGISEQAGPAPGRWPLFILLVNNLPALGLVFGAYLLVPYSLHLVFMAHRVQSNALGLNEVLQS